MDHETYARAEALLPANAERLVDGGETTARFLHGSDRFLLVESIGGEERAQLVDPDAGTCEEASAREREPLGEEWAVSPDERWAVRVDGGNLHLLDRDGHEERQITHDGTPVCPYGSRLDSYMVERQLRDQPPTPVVAWSPDSRRFVMERLDQSAVAETHLLRLVDDDPRPQLITWRDALPGDEHVATSQLHVVELASGVVTPAQMEPVPVGLVGLMMLRVAWFSPDGERVEAIVHNRDQREMRLLSIDARTGAVRVVATERGETVQNPALLLWDERAPARVLDDGRAVWLSERDGWGHLWLVDGDDWRQLTRGEWVVRGLVHVDEARGELLFTAAGREPDGRIYERRLYRVSLDGGEPELLTPEPLDHEVAVSPSGRWLVDCAASPEEPPLTVLRDARDGSVVRELARADASKLRAAGWRPPQRFTVTAADGETELHGMLYLPSDFDEGRSWPLLDLMYPGPQICLAPRRFAFFWGFESYAALGVVVMALDARGTPMRSKAFHDASYGVLETTHGLADHAAAVRQLAARHSWIDTTRVGMIGYSGGGYSTVRALIEQPETYTVGVSGIGNHDNRRYHAGWGERYIGLLEQNPEGWERQSNVARAARLRGHLLLMYQEMDANVHPIATRALIAALVDADVDHDVVVLPHGDHTPLATPYSVRRIWDYLARHLIGEEPPSYTIARDSVPWPPKEFRSS